MREKIARNLKKISLEIMTLGDFPKHFRLTGRK